jgi:hypothetical protein
VCRLVAALSSRRGDSSTVNRKRVLRLMGQHHLTQKRHRLARCKRLGYIRI